MYTTILTKQRLLSKEEAAKRAKSIAKLQKEIIMLVQAEKSQVIMHDVRLSRIDDRSIVLYFYGPLFYKKEIDCSLHFLGGDSKGFAPDLKIDTDFEIELNLYSDIETISQYKKLIKDHPKAFYHSYANYYFSSNGDYGKTMFLPDEIETTRIPLAPEIPIYKSIVTAEDFDYVERLLEMLLHRIEDYHSTRKLLNDFYS